MGRFTQSTADIIDGAFEAGNVTYGNSSTYRPSTCVRLQSILMYFVALQRPTPVNLFSSFSSEDQNGMPSVA